MSPFDHVSLCLWHFLLATFSRGEKCVLFRVCGLSVCEGTHVNAGGPREGSEGGRASDVDMTRIHLFLLGRTAEIEKDGEEERGSRAMIAFLDFLGIEEEMVGWALWEARGLKKERRERELNSQ